ncbi:MAG: hypothetical protein AB7V32_05785 [Candidatus Berkiella sp.]
MNKIDESIEFVADSISAAMRQVKAEFGPDAIILSQRIVDNKVRLTALPATAMVAQAVNSSLSANLVTGDFVNENVVKTDPLTSLLASPEIDETMFLKDDIFSETYLKNPHKKQEPVIDEALADYIKTELLSIKSLINEKLKVSPKYQTVVDYTFNQHQLSILKALHHARLVSPVVYQMIAELEPNLSKEESWESVIDKIVSEITFDEARMLSKRIISFVGPSGVGKSLLLAKLLVYFANKPLNNNFAIIFVNNNNLKVLEESHVYGRLFSCPCLYVESLEELENAYSQCNDKEHVFIDFPAYDFSQPENNYFVNFLQKYKSDIDNTLVVSSHCKYQYVQRFYNAFQKTLIDAISITKLDENASCEEIINFVISNKVPLRNLSSGTLNFTNGFSSNITFADKPYFYDYFTRSFLSCDKRSN